MGKSKPRMVPAEYYGKDYKLGLPVLQPHIDSQHCPFLGTTCKKGRKSTDVRMGICSLEIAGKGPVAICEHRFAVPEIKREIQRIYAPTWTETHWEPQIALNGDKIDLVLFNLENFPEEFLCVEQQTCGSTSTYWEDVQHFYKEGNYDHTPKKKPGLNRANEYVKTMMQQVCKKSRQLQKLSSRAKMVVVIQDDGMEYLKTHTDASDLIPGTNGPICFCSFRMTPENDSYVFKHAESLTTDFDGALKILTRPAKEVNEKKFVNYLYSRVIKTLS